MINLKDVPWFVWLILAVVSSYAFYVMVIVPGKQVSGAAANLATTAADSGGEIIKGATDAVVQTGELVKDAAGTIAKGVTKKCRSGFDKVGLDCLVKCPHGTSGLYCKKQEYNLPKKENLKTYKVSNRTISCKSGYEKLKWPNNKTCREIAKCKTGFTRLKFPNNNTCRSGCPQYTEKDFTGGCKRKPERYWF